jgi:hypothetical protein
VSVLSQMPVGQMAAAEHQPECRHTDLLLLLVADLRKQEW